MKQKEMPVWLLRLLQFLCFAITITLVYLLMPNTGRVDRYFEVGKPWGYDVLMAPFDFPIYKTEQRLAAERDSALCDLVPFYVLDTATAAQQTAAFDAADLSVNSRTKLHIASLISTVYSHGIMSLEEMQQLKGWKTDEVKIVTGNNEAYTRSIDYLFTQKTAYDFIINDLNGQWWVNPENVKTIGIDKYLKPNITLDKAKTNHAINEIANAVSPTSGMVQRGERIIDRGELITPAIFQILVSLERSNNGNLTQLNTDHWNVIGDVMIVVIVYILLFVYFYMFRINVLHSLKNTIFMLLMSLSMIALLSLCLHYDMNEYFMPMAILPIVIRVFFDSRTALYTHIITVLIAAQMVTDPIVFILIQILAGMVAVSSLKDLNSRGQLAQSAALVFLSYIVSYTALQLSHGIKPAEIDPWIFLILFVNAVSIMFAYVIIFIVEKIFGFLSSTTLVELSNINNPVLMEFSEKCPGTFQHVLQVSNLSVEVAKSIDANALLVRTGALYHDLGKMANPMYYTENQFSGFNPLSELPYEEAAQIIIRHTTDGIRLAERARLPRPIINFIASHHGTSKTRYFYNSYKNEFPDKEIDERLFTYPGPLPSTKEEAVLMMTDAIEAASRSLKVYDTETIDKMVENVVNGQIADGQFKNSPLSFKDVETAKSVFKDKLKNIYHTRISYPELKKPDAPKPEKLIFNKLRKAIRTN